MSNDKKTLADVKPGGMVRLATVPYDRARDLMGDAYNAGTHGIGYSQQAMELHDAIIHAQPSPGGQGGLNYERMFVDACAALAEVSRELGCDPEQGGAEPILAAIAELREALAARQPMGHVPAGFVLVPEKFGIPADVWEGVEFVIGGPGTGEGEAYLDSTVWIGDLMQDDGSSIYGLHLSCDECPEEGSVTLAEFAAAPAQAVDLERFRGTVKSQYSMTEWMHRCGFVSAQKLEESKKNHDHLLALIDSLAVRNG